MTEENYNYRTSQALLRNQFPGIGKLQIPIIPKFEAKPGDFDDLNYMVAERTLLMKHWSTGSVIIVCVISLPELRFFSIPSNYHHNIKTLTTS